MRETQLVSVCFVVFVGNLIDKRMVEEKNNEKTERQEKGTKRTLHRAGSPIGDRRISRQTEVVRKGLLFVLVWHLKQNVQCCCM